VDQTLRLTSERNSSWSHLLDGASQDPQIKIQIVVEYTVKPVYVNFEGNIEIWSHKTGGCLTQV
jgi:hypothetical protein